MSDPFIIMTAAQAALVRGPTAAGSALYPLPLAGGGSFVLPVGVLEDPSHAIHHGFLGELPRRTVEQAEWPVPIDEAI